MFFVSLNSNPKFIYHEYSCPFDTWMYRHDHMNKNLVIMGVYTHSQRVSLQIPTLNLSFMSVYNAVQSLFLISTLKRLYREEWVWHCGIMALT